MCILIADDQVSQVLISQELAKYRCIDIVQNGRAAVFAYVNTVGDPLMNSSSRSCTPLTHGSGSY